jgi:hypothetical protein
MPMSSAAIEQLTPPELQQLLVQLLRTVALKSGHEAVRQALIASFYPSPDQSNLTAPEWLPAMTEPEEPTSDDIQAADNYLAAVRQRLTAKYGSA